MFNEYLNILIKTLFLCVNMKFHLNNFTVKKNKFTNFEMYMN